jgi:hypothetical protein
MADLITNAEMKVKAMATTSITVATTRTGLNICEYQFNSIQFDQRGSDVNWYNGMLYGRNSRLSFGSWVRYESENEKCGIESATDL